MGDQVNDKVKEAYKEFIDKIEFPQFFIGNRKRHF